MFQNGRTMYVLFLLAVMALPFLAGCGGGGGTQLISRQANPQQVGSLPIGTTEEGTQQLAQDPGILPIIENGRSILPPTESDPEQPANSEVTRAMDAVDYAVSQINKPYKYGAAGPNEYDCSGLTQWSYAKVGKK